MAYNPYTPDQINSEIKRRGLENDHWGQYNLVKEFNADPAAFDTARGLAPGTASAWSANAQQQLAGPIADTRGLADSNPQMAYALTQQRGYTPGQADTLYGKDAGTSASWMQGQGYGGAPAPAPASGGNPYLQIGGTAPGPANNSPASPYTGAPGYMAAAPSGQGNPYLSPAGGPRSNGANDPRTGGLGPSWMKGMDGPSGGGPMGNQGFGGVADYLFDNPSTMAMGNEVARQTNNNLQRNILQGIRGNAMAAGTVGGSRQGVAEGIATGDAMSGLAGALANLYGGQFNQDRSHGLQSDALDFGIHRGNLQDMRQGQQDQLGFLGQMANWGQQGVATANQTRDRQFSDWNRFVGPASQMAGLGGSQSQNQQGNPYLGALGGWLAGTKGFGG
jgi:hypothetical protein